MEGEAQVETEAPVTEAPVEVTETPVEKPIEEAKPEGWDRVDLPPEAQKRFDRVYGNMKRYETDARELRDINQKLIDSINQLQDSQTKVVSHLQSQDFTQAESRIKDEAKQAYARGDVDGFFSANQKLAEITAKKTVFSSAPQQPIQQPRPPVQAVTPEDAINIAVRDGSVSNEEANIYRSWVNEADASGNLKRPWISAMDVRNSAAAIEGKAVFSNPAFANKPFAEKLREIDRRMGLRDQPTGGQTVLPAGNLTGAPRKSNVNLSPYQEKVAVMTKFGGSKAKTESDHIEAYRQAVMKSQNNKGARR